jgi:hypothetical protein
MAFNKATLGLLSFPCHLHVPNLRYGALSLYLAQIPRYHHVLVYEAAFLTTFSPVLMAPIT